MGHYEDLWYEIHESIEREGLRKQFNAQLKKMDEQAEHRHKDTREKWSYAHGKVLEQKRAK